MQTIKFSKVFNANMIEKVHKLAQEIWTEYYGPIIGKEQVSYMLRNFQSENCISQQIKKDFIYFLIERYNEYIGYICVQIKEETLFLSKIYLQLKHRNQGYGRESMAFIEKLARENNCSKIILNVNKKNTASIKAYEKYGFNNIGSIVKDIGNGFIMDDHKMEKIISAKL
ncbi:MAG: GNAT family N-acetyltransferase [Candidatus Omnitrophica bacterium]|nr:GNAT family N-acetyltransferase [Candidatus Omnitrophota bacterium]